MSHIISSRLYCSDENAVVEKKFNLSSIQIVTFENHNFYIKRDDQLDKDFSGNKARKFHYFLDHDFPHIKKVISHGSNQSNAMYSLSVLAKLKGWNFDYYVDHIPSWLQDNPSGNYANALKNDMNIKTEPMPKQFKADELFIDEGGAVKQAAYGINILAQEIKDWAKKNKYKNINIFLPSGTGTTALYLQKFLPYKVYTCACVGDEKYLEKQFYDLEDKQYHPSIVKTARKFHFGKLYKQNYEIWEELIKQTTIEFDLLYDPIGWQTLLQSDLIKQDVPIIYIHQGGLLGNETMKQRYERKITNQ